MSAPPRAAAVVVSYNSGGQIADCLDALEPSGLPVLVIDNASTDDTLERIGVRPGVQVLADGVNTGFAAAVNTAWRTLDRDHDQDRDRHGAPEVLLLVNPDCVVPARTVAALLGALAEDPQAVIAGPALVDAGGRPTPGARTFESLASVLGSRFGGSLLPAPVRRRLSGAPAGDPVRPVGVDWLCGACLAVRVDLLRRTGGLDERYFLYYEDEDLCRRAHALGGRVVFLAGVSAGHLGGASSRPGETWPHLYRSMIEYFAVHHPRQLPALRVVLVLRSVLGLGRERARAAGRCLVRDSAPDDGRSLRWQAWRQVLALTLVGPSRPVRAPEPSVEPSARPLQGARP